MRWLTLALSAGLIFSIAHACGKGKGKKEGNGTPAPDIKSNPLKDALGDNVKTDTYDNSGYDAKHGQVSGPDDLKCDFEGPCCWKNSKPPYDSMDFLKASGSPDPDKFKKAFGTSITPSGNFLVTSTNNAAGPNDKAELESCVIPCASDTIKVSFKHWVSKGAKLQVCEIAKSDPNMLLNCQNVPTNEPGPDTVQLPAGSDIIISIIATNFLQAGGIAILDDITVDFSPCTTSTSAASTPAASTTTGPTQPTLPGDVVKHCCDFSNGPCGWSRGGGSQSAKGHTKSFENAGPDYYRNRATGVAPSPDRKFVAAYLKPHEKAYMESTGTFGDSYIIKFQEYKATQDLSLKACCDSDASCTYDTGGKVEKGDFRQWYQGSIECPAGTQKVIFYAQDAGNNEGGVGIDNIEVYDKAGNNLCTTVGKK